jgi:hypothetical protein
VLLVVPAAPGLPALPEAPPVPLGSVFGTAEVLVALGVASGDAVGTASGLAAVVTIGVAVGLATGLVTGPSGVSPLALGVGDVVSALAVGVVDCGSFASSDASVAQFDASKPRQGANANERR